MPGKMRVLDVRIKEDAEGRAVVETYDDGSVVRRRVEKDARPRRKPRKPIARVWRPRDNGEL
jgi:hypothetical protein